MAPFILPSPLSVLVSAMDRIDELAKHALITTLEIIIGLFSGTVFGIISALSMVYFRPARSWLLPVLVYIGWNRGGTWGDGGHGANDLTWLGVRSDVPMCGCPL